jgi:hypothetical protein
VAGKEVQFRTVPPGAAVYDQFHNLLGYSGNVTNVELERYGSTLELEFRAPGYEPATWSFNKTQLLGNGPLPDPPLHLNLFPTSLATLRQSEQRYQAAMIAASQLEKATAAPASQTAIGTDLALLNQVVNGVTYSTNLFVGPVNSENPNYLRQITVTVTWKYSNTVHTMLRQIWLHHLPSEQ